MISSSTIRKVLTRLAAGGGLAWLVAAPGISHAAPTLGFSLDGGAMVTCGDQDISCDVLPIDGGVTYLASIGGVFTVNITTGLSSPILSGMPSLMDLNTVTFSGMGDHTLSILFSDTDFTQSGLISGQFGGTLTSGVGSSISASAYYSLTNSLFDMTNLLGSIGPFGPGAFAGSFTGAAVGGSPYSLTQVMTLTSKGSTLYSGDFELKVPEPASLALVGIALLGLGVASRRPRG